MMLSKYSSIRYQNKFVIGFILNLIPVLFASNCIHTKVGDPCQDNEDCFKYDEHHLYCNTTEGINVCAFYMETYVGEAAEGWDCPGQEYSAESWSNPVDLVGIGMDCMRLCHNTQTCFGVSLCEHKCYLKNEKCFTNLKESSQCTVGVISIVREDYRCGCHYPFTRKKSNGEFVKWSSECPESQLTRNPYRCCSEKGLCIRCDEERDASGAIINVRNLTGANSLMTYFLRR